LWGGDCFPERVSAGDPHFFGQIERERIVGAIERRSDDSAAGETRAGELRPDDHPAFHGGDPQTFVESGADGPLQNPQRNHGRNILDRAALGGRRRREATIKENSED